MTTGYIHNLQLQRHPCTNTNDVCIHAQVLTKSRPTCKFSSTLLFGLEFGDADGQARVYIVVGPVPLFARSAVASKARSAARARASRFAGSEGCTASGSVMPPKNHTTLGAARRRCEARRTAGVTSTVAFPPPAAARAPHCSR
eukprot:366382-Chlamydomonas_euryale.AAC.2